MPIRKFTSVLAFLVISGCATAQTAKPDQDHSAHHPPAVAAQKATAQPDPEGASSTQAYHRQMKAMQEMHLKMQAAKTPAELAALMKEHMQLMRAGASMMGKEMPAPGTPTGSAAPSGSSGTGMQGMTGEMSMHMQMERRMSLMEHMLQMMVDRLAPVSGLVGPPHDARF